MCLEVRIAVDTPLNLRHENSWLEPFVLDACEIEEPLAQSFAYRVSGRVDGCGCVLLDDGVRSNEDFEPDDQDVGEALTREAARRDLTLLLERCAQQGLVELLVCWNGDECRTVPVQATVQQVMAHPRVFVGEHPYFFRIKRRLSLRLM